MQTVSYKFIVKTDKYTGNFERQLCAYITGQIGECEVGDKQAKDFKDEYGEEICSMFEEIIQNKADEHGCYRPCNIRQTHPEADNYVHETYEYNGNTYNSVCHNDMEIYFYNKPTQEMIDIMKKRAYEYGKMKNIKIYGFELQKEIVTYEYESEEI